MINQPFSPAPVITWLFILIISLPGWAQTSDEADTTYYKPYPNKITGRFYFSKKFTTLILNNKGGGPEFRYRPNTTLNMGVGATYKGLTLNLAYGFGFLNPERGKGKTKYLDLQFHNYSRKWAIDLVGSFYTGFYLTPKGKATTGDEAYYVRPDMKINAGGVTVQHIFNHKRFSYRAAFLQNEWQRRSAGTFLAGLDLYAGSVQADSAFIPTKLDSEGAAIGLKEMRFFEIGPSIGYAYTYVHKSHIFITGAGSASLSTGFNKFYDSEGKTSATGLTPNALLKIFVGYNSPTWALSALYISNVQSLARASEHPSIRLNTGNLRLNFIYRFVPGKKAKKILKPIDKLKPSES